MALHLFECGIRFVHEANRELENHYPNKPLQHQLCALGMFWHQICILGYQGINAIRSESCLKLSRSVHC